MDGIQSKYCCPQRRLPRNFNYPEGYFDYIYFDDEESDQNEFTSTISFLEIERIISFLDEAKKSSMFRRLIPFGQDDDDLFCFDSRGEKVYVIDLSNPYSSACELPYKDFFEFINAIRVEKGLQPWSPIHSHSP